MASYDFPQVPSVDYSSYRSQTPRLHGCDPDPLQLDSQPQDLLLDRISFIASKDNPLAPGKPSESLRITTSEAALNGSASGQFPAPADMIH